MDRKPLSERLREGNMLGGWCGFASFSSVELMCQFDYDAVVLDMQHCEFSQAHFPGMLGAFPADGPYAIVRAARNDYHLINWLFDLGVPGVLVPMINSAEEARAAVRAAKFPPVGRRSFGPFRAARYGTALAPYIASADGRATLIVQVEDAECCRSIDSILEIEGVDAVMMGPNDLAYSMLRKGESLDADPTQWSAFARTPAVIELCEQVLERCKAASMPFGITAGGLEEARQWLEKSASLATFGSDFSFLRMGAERSGIRLRGAQGRGHA